MNITEDSYSDGGLYLQPQDALRHARELHADGADIIELGPAASNPDAADVTAEEEARRLLPVIRQLVYEGIVVSVDSARPETQRLALAEGASYLNDIRGFPDPSLYVELARADCRLVVMHSIQRTALATRVETSSASIRSQIDAFFEQRLAALQAAGIPRERVILDPGLGYFLGSNPEPSLTVIAHLAQLKERFGAPVLLSPSRKSFLRTITGRDLARIGPASLAAELYASGEGVDYVRTHDVAALHDALLVLELIRRHA